jgi:hypothetical protein
VTVGKPRAVLALALGVVLGCVDEAKPAAGPVGTVEGRVVAEVDGDLIGLGEVQRLCDRTGLSPRAALERLVGERLLVQRAAEQGYGDLPAVERAAARARVRALLASTIEASAAGDTVSDQRAKLERLLAELAQRSKVAYDEAAIRHAFAAQPH